MGKSDRKIRIYSALEVANLCGVVNQTAINWIKGGHLKAFTTPGGQFRVYEEDLVDFLKSRNMRIPAQLESVGTEEVDTGLVLIVDDDKDLNSILKRLLERKLRDVAIAQAFDGFEAGRIIAEQRPAVIFLDIGLPGVDGTSLCTRIRSDPTLGKPSVLAMTGLDRDDAKDEILKAGADDFLPKPLDFDKAILRVSELLEARRAGSSGSGSPALGVGGPSR